MSNSIRLNRAYSLRALHWVFSDRNLVCPQRTLTDSTSPLLLGLMSNVGLPVGLILRSDGLKAKVHQILAQPSRPTVAFTDRLDLHFWAPYLTC